MLRMLIAALAATLTACASAPAHTTRGAQTQSVPVRVTGAGATMDDAMRNAFKLAVQEVVGTVVVAGVDVHSGRLTHDEILAHSSGYVDRYSVISRTGSAGSVIIEMQVWVNSSKIANRILGANRQTNTIDGDRHSTQYHTYLEQQQTGDALLGTVLRDHPRRAYTVWNEPAVMRVDWNRNPVITIPYTITWNVNYLRSFEEALTTLGAKPRTKTVGEYFRGTWEANRTGRVVNGDLSSYEFTAVPEHVGVVNFSPDSQRGRMYYITDRPRLQAIMQAFHFDRVPYVRVRVYSTSGSTVYDRCHDPEAIFYSGSRSARLNIVFGQRKRGQFEIMVPGHQLVALQATEVTVVAGSDCPR